MVRPPRSGAAPDDRHVAAFGARVVGPVAVLGADDGIGVAVAVEIGRVDLGAEIVEVVGAEDEHDVGRQRRDVELRQVALAFDDAGAQHDHRLAGADAVARPARCRRSSASG